jgi:hypothetical protein
MQYDVSLGSIAQMFKTTEIRHSGVRNVTVRVTLDFDVFDRDFHKILSRMPYRFPPLYHAPVVDPPDIDPSQRVLTQTEKRTRYQTHTHRKTRRELPNRLGDDPPTTPAVLETPCRDTDRFLFSHFFIGKQQNENLSPLSKTVSVHVV